VTKRAKVDGSEKRELKCSEGKGREVKGREVKGRSLIKHVYYH